MNPQELGLLCALSLAELASLNCQQQRVDQLSTVPIPISTPEPSPTPVIFIPRFTPTPTSYIWQYGGLEIAQNLENLNLKYQEDYATQIDWDYKDYIERFCLRLPEHNQEPPINQFQWPTHGPIFTFFSGRHKALDISPPFGTPIFAPADGYLAGRFSDVPNGYGNHLIIAHPDNYLTIYAHMWRMTNAPLGSWIPKGAHIGDVGVSGLATGPHLHFETWKDCQAIDPLAILPR